MTGLVTVLLGVSALGCTRLGAGVRTGTSVSRTSAPVPLMSNIGAPARDADASLSQEFAELEGSVDIKRHLRGLLVFGGGAGHARYRAIDTQVGMPIFAKDDNFVMRAGAGLGLAGLRVGPVRPVPYALYVTNFESSDNTVKHTVELGVSVELEQADDDGGAAAIVLGAALVIERGLSYADFGSFDTYTSDYDTTGFLLSVGVRLGKEVGE